MEIQHRTVLFVERKEIQNAEKKENLKQNNMENQFEVIKSLRIENGRIKTKLRISESNLIECRQNFVELNKKYEELFDLKQAQKDIMISAINKVHSLKSYRNMFLISSLILCFALIFKLWILKH